MIWQINFFRGLSRGKLFYEFYVSYYPGMPVSNIGELCDLLNRIWLQPLAICHRHLSILTEQD